jgi:hypothetical protein
MTAIPKKNRRGRERDNVLHLSTINLILAKLSKGLLNFNSLGVTAGTRHMLAARFQAEEADV